MCNLCPEDNAGFDPEFEQTLNILLDTYTYVNDGLPTPDESPVDASGHADSFEFGLPGPSTSPAITTPTLDGSSTDAELYLPGPSSSPNTVGFNEPRLPLVFGADQPAAFSFDFEQEGQNPGPQVPAVPQVTDIPGRRRGNFASRVHPSVGVPSNSHLSHC
ncbi:hypothetical protein BC834DRAFT_310028 [Gloeopeniophorella convolvens]|nr:hypothetical protein BC834DRAFT_310028 [Gloeopeniophorella convolvens]